MTERGGREKGEGEREGQRERGEREGQRERGERDKVDLLAVDYMSLLPPKPDTVRYIVYI